MPASPRFEKFRHSIWIKNAVVYLLVLSVPFFAFSIYFNLYVTRETKQSIETALTGHLQQIQRDFDQRTRQMNAICAQLEKNRDFALVAAPEYQFNVQKGILNSLITFSATSLFPKDIIFYHQQLPYLVFTSTGTYSSPYYRQLLRPDTHEWLTLDAYQKEKLPTGWITHHENQSGLVDMNEALLYSVPMNGVSGGYVLFEISEGCIRDLFASAEKIGEALIFEGDQVLYPFHYEGGFPENLVPGEAPVRRADGRYQCARISPVTGLTYVYIAETSDIGAVARNMLNSFMLLSMILSLACFAAVVMASRRHAKPIEQLVTLADGIAPDNVHGVARIESAMNQLQSRSQELDAVRQDTLRGHVLIRLVRGKYRDEQEAEDNLHRLNMAFRQPVKVIMLLQGGLNGDDPLMLSRITELLARQHDLYGFAYAERSVYVMLAGLDSADLSSLQKELEALAAQPELAGSRLHFSVGSPFTALMQARESFMQALASSRRNPAEAVTLYQKADEEELFYPREELQALHTALQNQDRNRTAFLYDVLLQLVKKHNHLYFYTVSLLSEMINLYLEAMPLQGSAEKEGSYADQLKRQYINDVEDMLSFLQKLHTRALQLMTESDLSSSTTEMIGIANYISTREDLGALTVGAVADCFGMNVSSLSHKFKEQMGCNISDYILACKMNHACILLRSTDETVADIAEKLGYSQYTSFVRTFKREKGLTPTAYRDAWRSEKKQEP